MTGAAAVDRNGASVGFPLRDSYDMQLMPPNQSAQAELHYQKKWTGYGPGAPTGLADEPRQLYYREPPDSTVVTSVAVEARWT